MKLAIALAFSLALSTTSLAQDVSREQKFLQIKELNSQIDKAVRDLLLPSTSDRRDAESEGVEVFRLMPREIFGRNIVSPAGGGAYYSFTTKSHDYGKSPLISLEQNSLHSGFSGANYGLLADLGEMPLSKVTSETPETAYLLKYRPATNIIDARAEKRNTWAESLTYKGRVSAVAGHTYVLRAIDYGNADVAVAFRIVRKDADGSLIVFWKMMGDFGKPMLDPNIREN